jgi:hypothetical protein
MNQLVPVTSAALPALVIAAGDRASMRFLEFSAANIRNPHTRRAYARAAEEFSVWCGAAGVASITDGQLGATGAGPSVVQALLSRFYRRSRRKKGLALDPILDPNAPIRVEISRDTRGRRHILND